MTVFHEECLGCGVRFMRDVGVDKVAYKLERARGWGGGPRKVKNLRFDMSFWRYSRPWMRRGWSRGL